MELVWSIFLGAVQGLTEFFPVSSSAHLLLMPYIFKFQDPGLAFDIALHAGTLLAILFAFWNEWWTLAKGVIEPKMNFEKKFIGFLILTTIPGALFGYFLEEKAHTVFRNPLITVFTLVAFGFLLYWVDKDTKKKEEIKSFSWWQAVLVGLSQGVALVPGVSRSGATITAARALGLSREAAVKYSFMAAAPIIAGATVFGLRDVSVATLTTPTWIIGLLVSLVASFWAIKFLTKFVKAHDFKIFMYYRFGLAVLVLLLYIMRG